MGPVRFQSLHELVRVLGLIDMRFTVLAFGKVNGNDLSRYVI